MKFRYNCLKRFHKLNWLLNFLKDEIFNRTKDYTTQITGYQIRMNVFHQYIRICQKLQILWHKMV